MSNKRMPEFGEIVHVNEREYVVTAVGSVHIHLRSEDDDSLVVTVPEIDEYKPRTVTVEYDLSPVEHELAIREKLINMGWTPPKE